MAVKICGLIPSYNEARTIGGIVRELALRGIAAYVIDDGSVDDTASIAASAGAVVLKHERNKGKGASLREGFKHILKKDFDAVIIMDGDAQHRPGDIDDFLKRMEQANADMVIGNRMNDTSSMPIIRIWTNRFMSWLISLVCGQRVPDSQCGFRLIKKKVLERVELRSSNYEIESEMIIGAARAGFKIESVPIKTVYQNEASRINPFADTIRFLAFIVRAAFER